MEYAMYGSGVFVQFPHCFTKMQKLKAPKHQKEFVDKLRN